MKYVINLFVERFLNIDVKSKLKLVSRCVHFVESLLAPLLPIMVRTSL